MNATVAPVRPSPVQDSVSIVQAMAQGGIQAQDYSIELERLHAHMAAFAMAHVRAEGYEQHMKEADPDYVLTLEEVTAGENDATPMAECYWQGTSLFFRKVFQAAAAAA